MIDPETQLSNLIKVKAIYFDELNREMIYELENGERVAQQILMGDRGVNQLNFIKIK